MPALPPPGPLGGAPTYRGCPSSAPPHWLFPRPPGMLFPEELPPSGPPVLAQMPLPSEARVGATCLPMSPSLPLGVAPSTSKGSHDLLCGRRSHCHEGPGPSFSSLSYRALSTVPGNVVGTRVSEWPLRPPLGPSQPVPEAGRLGLAVGFCHQRGGFHPSSWTRPGVFGQRPSGDPRGQQKKSQAWTWPVRAPGLIPAPHRPPWRKYESTTRASLSRAAMTKCHHPGCLHITGTRGLPAPEAGRLKSRRVPLGSFRGCERESSRGPPPSVPWHLSACPYDTPAFSPSDCFFTRTLQRPTSHTGLKPSRVTPF